MIRRNLSWIESDGHLHHLSWGQDILCEVHLQMRGAGEQAVQTGRKHRRGEQRCHKAMCAQMTTSGQLSCLLSLHPQDFTHRGQEDVEQARIKQGPKECVEEEAYLTPLSALFVMMRVCWAGSIPAW